MPLARGLLGTQFNVGNTYIVKAIIVGWTQVLKRGVIFRHMGTHSLIFQLFVFPKQKCI